MRSLDAWPSMTEAAWAVAATASVAVPVWGLGALARRWRRLPAAVATSVALALLIVFDGLVVNLLSLLGLLDRAGVLVAQGALSVALIVARLHLAHRGVRLSRKPWRGSLARAWAVVPFVLLGLVLASGLRYAPNNGDSMTYHLARVAHWIQEGSVAPYASGSIRQNAMMPGAEYVLLVLQLASGTDRLAPLLQTLGYVLVVFSAPWLARLAGASAGQGRVAAILVATSPIFLLEASSTQNDLVAAVVAVALIAAILPFVHRRRPTPASLLVAAAAASAAMLVKATALLAVAPIAVLALFRGARSLGRDGRTMAALALGVAILLFPGFELARRDAFSRASLVVPVYPAAGEWADRASNVLRGFLHHAPGAAELPPTIRPEVRPELGGWLRSPVLAPHEDLASSGVLAGFALASLLVGAARWRHLRSRARLAVCGWAAAWVLFHVTFRDNEFLVRLQVPLLALSPALAASWPKLRASWWRRVARAGVAAVAVLATGLGVAAAARNELRPPLEARRDSVELDYYRNHGELVRGPQDSALRLAERIHCSRIGLYMGESGFDYPISWRAIARGASTRHVVADDGWPCMIYVEQVSWGRWNLPRTPVQLDPGKWEVAQSSPLGPFLFVRRGAGGE